MSAVTDSLNTDKFKSYIKDIKELHSNIKTQIAEIEKSHCIKIQWDSNVRLTWNHPEAGEITTIIEPSYMDTP